MMRVSPFVKAVERACRERTRYTVYLGEEIGRAHV